MISGAKFLVSIVVKKLNPPLIGWQNFKIRLFIQPLMYKKEIFIFHFFFFKFHIFYISVIIYIVSYAIIILHFLLEKKY